MNNLTQTTLIKPDIITVLEREGVALKQRGKDFCALCPLHSEKTPSFKIDPERQTFYCFGCGAGGDVITFIQKLKGYSFKDACRYLGISPGKPYKPNTREIKKRDAVKKFKAWCEEYYNKCCEFYRLWYQVKMNIRTIEEAEKYALFYHREPIITYQMDILFSNDNEAKFQIYKGVNYED